MKREIKLSPEDLKIDTTEYNKVVEEEDAKEKAKSALGMIFLMGATILATVITLNSCKKTEKELQIQII